MRAPCPNAPGSRPPRATSGTLRGERGASLGRRRPPRIRSDPHRRERSSQRRRRADSNRCTRLCRPLPNHSATSPGEGIVARSTRCIVSAWVVACRSKRPSDTIRPGAWGTCLCGNDREGEHMTHTRGRLVVACLALIGAAMIAVAGGSAGNRTATTPFEFLPGDSFTYGETFATEATITNSGSSMFTQIEVHHAIPAVAGSVPDPADAPRLVLWRGHRGERSRLPVRPAEFQVQPLTVTFVWRAPTSGAGAAAGNEWLLDHQGREANQPQRAFRLRGRAVHGLASRQRPDYGKEAGRRIRDPRCRDLYCRVGQPAHQPGAHPGRPRLLDALSARRIHDPDGKLRARVLVDDHRDLGEAVERLAQRAWSVDDLRCGTRSGLWPHAHAGQLGHDERGASDLPHPRIGVEGPEDDHQGLPQRS